MYVVEASVANSSSVPGGRRSVIGQHRDFTCRSAPHRVAAVTANLRVEAVAPLIETETSEEGLVVAGVMIADGRLFNRRT